MTGLPVSEPSSVMKSLWITCTTLEKLAGMLILPALAIKTKAKVPNRNAAENLNREEFVFVFMCFYFDKVNVHI
jgi:hypothetical protein